MMQKLKIKSVDIKIVKNKLVQLLAYIYTHFIKFPLYMLSHPIDGFYEMKHYHRGLLRVAYTFFAIHAVLGIVEFTYTGFLFNTTDPTQFKMIRSMLVAIAPFFIFIVGNWSITSLMDGKGKFKEIFITTGYTLFPLIILRIVNIFLSNYFTLDEAFFYHGINVLGYILMFTMLFMGIRSIHEYSVLRAISTILLTILAMTVIVFLGLLAMSLAQQITVFIETIIKELNLRL
jgi:hypothetical protein